jgi:hypothetical protein
MSVSFLRRQRPCDSWTGNLCQQEEVLISRLFLSANGTQQSYSCLNDHCLFVFVYSRRRGVTKCLQDGAPPRS